jgi:hypothetical protein
MKSKNAVWHNRGLVGREILESSRFRSNLLPPYSRPKSECRECNGILYPGRGGNTQLCFHRRGTVTSYSSVPCSCRSRQPVGKKPVKGDPCNITGRWSGGCATQHRESHLFWSIDVRIRFTYRQPLLFQRQPAGTCGYRVRHSADTQSRIIMIYRTAFLLLWQFLP